MDIKIKLFSTSLDVDDEQEAEINNFLDSVRVISKQIVCLDRLDPPRWAVCIVYESPTSMTSVVMPTSRLKSLKSSGLRKGKERIDYRELLSERDFSIFLDLKKLRKELAVEQGYQEFVIFTAAKAPFYEQFPTDQDSPSP